VKLAPIWRTSGARVARARHRRRPPLHGRGPGRPRRDGAAATTDPSRHRSHLASRTRAYAHLFIDPGTPGTAATGAGEAVGATLDDLTAGRPVWGAPADGAAADGRPKSGELAGLRLSVPLPPGPGSWPVLVPPSPAPSRQAPASRGQDSFRDLALRTHEVEPGLASAEPKNS
jgi:hypothetical protein